VSVWRDGVNLRELDFARRRRDEDAAIRLCQSLVEEGIARWPGMDADEVTQIARMEISATFRDPRTYRAPLAFVQYARVRIHRRLVDCWRSASRVPETRELGEADGVRDAGVSPLDSVLAREREAGASRRPVLSERQRQVVTLYAEGLTRQEIAGALGIGVESVKSCLRDAADRVGVPNKAQLLARYAVRAGLVQP
jgi:DNA-binding CsgD family transcriptional regulator